MIQMIDDHCQETGHIRLCIIRLLEKLRHAVIQVCCHYFCNVTLLIKFIKTKILFTIINWYSDYRFFIYNNAKLCNALFLHTIN